MFGSSLSFPTFPLSETKPSRTSEQRQRSPMVSIARSLSMASLGLFAVATTLTGQSTQHYKQTNLISDIPGMAAVTDPNLVNPWGMSRSSGSPWWVSDNGTGVSTLYTGAGAPVPLVVTVPTGDTNNSP